MIKSNHSLMKVGEKFLQILKRNFFLLFAILFIATGVFLIWAKFTPIASTCKNCNVILISVDTLRTDRVGAYGYPKNTTPNIDKLSKKSTIFERAYVTAPWTLPSYTAMLTGVFQNKFNIELSVDKLPDEATTIAEILKKNGYRTAAFSNGAFVVKKFGFAQGFDEFAETQQWQDAEMITKDTIAWLEKNKGKKFFLFLRPFHVHDPYDPKEEFIKQVDGNYLGNLERFDISQIVKLNKGEIKLPQQELKRISQLYDAEIAEMDAGFGKIFQKLNDLKLNKKTIIILTSDHGEEFGERGTWGMHGTTTYEEVINVPLIIKTPNQLLTKRIDTAVQTLDILPTTLSLLGIKLPQNLDGQIIIGANSKFSKNRIIYAETAIQKESLLGIIEEGYKLVQEGKSQPQDRDKNAHLPKAKTVISGNLKFIQNFDGSIEFYNLKNDPYEKNNLTPN